MIGCMGPIKIRQDAEHNEIEFFNLVAAKNRVRHTLHSGLDLIDRHDFRRVGGRGKCGDRD